MTEEELLTLERRLERANKRIDRIIGGGCKFERGVRLITKERRLDRAMKWFLPFIRFRSADEKVFERAIAELQEKGFKPHQVVTLRDAFAKWKAEEKSRKAKQSRQARGKQGRVRSKNDKRLGARPPGGFGPRQTFLSPT
jgi:hypothetical protein